MLDNEEIKKKIESVDYSIYVLQERRNQLCRELHEDEWEENKFRIATETRNTAEFFYGLNYFIKELKDKDGTKELKDKDENKELKDNDKNKAEYRLAKKFWKFRNFAVDFLRKLASFPNQGEMTYSIADLNKEDQNNLRNLCREMEKQGWIKFEEADEDLKISEVNSKYYLAGNWAEFVNRFLLYITLLNFATKNKLKYKVFWNVKLLKVKSGEINYSRADMELDIVAELNDKFYIFETKSGKIEIPKERERAKLFNTSKSRYILCCLKDENCKDFNTIIPLEKLEEDLPKLLAEDFKGEIAGTDANEA